MAKAENQISAYISLGTNEMVERYAKARGLKKAHLIEDALLHHLQALRELPADIIIPPRIRVDEKTAEALRRRVHKPRQPTKAMKVLFPKGSRSTPAQG